MNTDPKSPTARKPAPASGPRNAPPAPGQRQLSLATEPPKAASEQRNPDPYNSSGSFDRTKNWARVGKR